MLEKLKRLVNKKWFHFVAITVIIVVLLFILGITILDYNENGESNMPFNLTKISIISTSEGIDKQSEGNKWAFDINQNNDIYLYISKNENYEKTDTIKNVIIDNFQTTKQNENSEIKILKPDSENENQIFTNSEKNVLNSIEYLGGTESDFKNLKISNQGDILTFRCSNTKIASYESNDDVEINHSELLKKAGLTMNDINMTLTFDITISLNSGKSFKGTVNLSLPTGNVIENPTSNIEITDLKNVIFKRIQN